ncbi:hypothetical protein [Dactylosporangium salmoneum]|uniref:AAA+ ATPase domain-containing protein n=1 Tax=Dactylosporangium salmoneum TaxID=53361 RepID=A0ABN3H8E1_9ACTN
MGGRRSGLQVRFDDEVQAPTPVGWPTGSDVLALVDPHSVAQRLLEEVSNEDMLTLLRRVGPEVARVALHVINLNLSGRVNAGMAGQLLVRLRHDKATASSHALRALLFPVVEVFRRLTLSADDWRTLVESDTSRVAYQFDEPYFRGIRTVPESLRPVGFAVAIAHRSSAAAAALGFLARKRPELSGVYETLRAQYPALPAQYVVDVADLERGGTHERQSEATAEPFEPGVALERLEQCWNLGRQAAERIVAALASGRLPAESDIAALSSLDGAVQQIAQQLADHAGELVAPDLNAVRAAVAAIERMRRSDWLRHLSELSTPPNLAEPLDELRAVIERVRTTTPDEAELQHLRAFYDFVVLAVTSPDEARDHAGRLGLDETLPKPLSTLVIKEVMRPGLLSLPPAAFAAAASGLSASAPVAIDADPDMDGTEDGGAGTPVPASPVEPPAAAESAGVPSESGDAPDAIDALDAELDELLDEDFDRLFAAPERDEAADTGHAEHEPARPPAEQGAAAAEDEHLGTAPADAIGHGGQPEAVAPPAANFPQYKPDLAPESAELRSPDTDDVHGDAEPADASEFAEVRTELIERHRFGLAACIAEAIGRPPAVVAARRAAALAANMRASAGSVAAAFAASAERLTRANLADDRAGQLLGWGATVSVAASTHMPQLVPVLDDLQLAIEDFAGLTVLGRALSDATRSGIVVAQETGTTMATTLDLEQEAARHATRAAYLTDTARSRSIKYAPASAVYQAWMSERGLLGSLLRLVMRNDAVLLTEVREKILEAQGQEDRQIDDQYSRQRGRRQAKIEAGARQKLRTQYRDALNVASEWVGTMERIGQWQDQHSDPSAERVNRIRREILRCREDVRQDIQRLQAEEGARGRLEAAAAAGAIGELVQRVYDQFNAQAATDPAGSELSADYVVNRELVATDLFLDQDRLRPDQQLGSAHLDQLLHVASRPALDLDELYTHRTRLGDHDIAQRLIDEARVVDPDLAEALAVRWAADEAERGAQIRPAVEALKRLVEQERMAGVLDEHQWSVYAVEVERLETHGRRDYRRIEDEVALLTNELLDTRVRVIERMLAAIDREAFDKVKVAAHQERLKAMARQGEIAGAEEYLEQLRAGRDLPAPDRSAGHLSRFFPAVPDLFVTYPALLESLLGGLQQDAIDAGLEAFHQATEMSVKTLDDRRRRAGARSLESWLGLSARRLRAHGLDTQRALAEVLSQAGIDFKSAIPDSNETKERRWWTLTDVRIAGRAANPVLGSRMSPDGATLRVLVLHSAQSATRLIESLRDQSEDHTVLVVWLGAPMRPAERRVLMEATRGRPRPSVLLIDAAVLAYLVMQPEALRGPFVDIVLPFTAANPYQDKAGDAAEEMFFGRSRELREVQAMDGSSIVYGGRQLGKSALLRAAQREFVRRNRSSVAAYLSIFSIGSDGQAGKLWPELWHKLAEYDVLPDALPQEDLARGVYDGVRNWLRDDPSRTLLVLLDEADAFLEADSKQYFVEIDWFRRIMQDPGSAGRVKIVLAGLHRTARFSAVPNQPLSHFGQPILIGPLGPQQAYDMIIQPLATLGLRFDNPQTAPARIMAYTNNIPALLQILGQALVTQAFSRPVTDDEPPGVITDEDVTAVINNAGLHGQLVQKYNLTLDLDHRYRVIALVLALAAHEEEAGSSGLPVEEIAQRCRMYWPAGFLDSPSDLVASLVDECVDLGVLARDESRYRIRTPTVLRLLGDHESVLQRLFSAPEQLEVPSVSRRLHFRRDLGDGCTWRSPLTELQVDRIAKASGPLLVVGTRAHGIHFVPRALEAMRGQLSVDEVRRLPKPSIEQIRHSVGLHPRSLTLVDATRMSADDLYNLYREVDRAWRVVIMAGLTSAPAWIRIDQRVALSRLGRDGLRLWCEEENLAFHDAADQRTLDAKVGGWPLLLERVTHKARVDGNLNAEQLLAWFDGWWAGRGAAALLADLGLDDPNDPVVRALLAALDAAREIVPVGVQDQSVLVEMLGEQLESTIAGFAGPQELFDVLCVLGLFDIDKNVIQLEPVHLDAIRRTAASHE